MSVLPTGLQLALPAWAQKQVRKIRKPERVMDTEQGEGGFTLKHGCKVQIFRVTFPPFVAEL